jgi:hypothetical protein
MTTYSGVRPSRPARLFSFAHRRTASTPASASRASDLGWLPSRTPRDGIHECSGLIQGESQAFGCAARLHEFVQLNGMGAIASIFQELRRERTTGGDHDLFADTDRIAGKSERFFFRHREPTILRDPFRDGRLAVGIEGRGQVEQVPPLSGQKQVSR